MGNLIPFTNQRNQNLQKNNLLVLQTMKDSPIRANLRILNDETHALIRVLYDERKNVENALKDVTLAQHVEEREYWSFILSILNGVLKKFSKVLPVEEVLRDLSFAEMDCLIGVVEEYLHEHYLEDMQMIEDSTPLITRAISSFYASALPIYEEKRDIFEKEQREKL